MAFKHYPQISKEDIQNLKQMNKSELHKLNIEVTSDLQKQKTSNNSIF